jgi:hypothetical protein
MNESFVFEFGQNLRNSFSNPRSGPSPSVADGCDQFADTLPAIKKIDVNEILRWHKVQSRSPVVIKQQPEFFFPDLNVVSQLIPHVRWYITWRYHFLASNIEPLAQTWIIHGFH